MLSAPNVTDALQVNLHRLIWLCKFNYALMVQFCFSWLTSYTHFLNLLQVAPVIKARMMKYGSLMIGYNPDGNLVNFFRMVVSNFDVTTEDMDFLVKEIDRLGKDL